MVLELAPRDEAFSADFDSVFARWRAALVTHFEPLGIAPDRGRGPRRPDHRSALEGALILSRAARSIEPFNTTTEALISAIDHDPAAPSLPTPLNPGPPVGELTIAGRAVRPSC